MTILDKIKNPADIKKLSLGELEKLSQEIREYIINTVSVTGGHLGPNLGVVELTLALHSVYNSPKDKIIWDVGHQAYIHKIITGRKIEFQTIRQFDGLSGFPKREESPHDVFGTGHSSTSISGAVGMAKARDLLGEKHEVVAVIGDGAMTGGMAFEALNHAGHLGLDMLVVLNDNKMSIAPNVGAMSSYLSRLRVDPFYTKRKEDIEWLLNRVPHIGTKMAKAAEKIKDTVKYFLIPGMLFEELGFTYLGPIDGHNIAELKTVLAKARTTMGPVLVHVLTEKGRGYEPARKYPNKFHGVGTFDIKTGKAATKSELPTYTQVFSDTIVNLAEKNKDIVAITAAMPDGTGLSDFANKYPSRFIDVGIAEQHAVTMAAALGLEGLKPVVAIYSTFMQRSYDQVIHDVCLQKAPVVFALDRAGLVGDDGPTHHGVFDFSFLRHIPEIVVMAPKDENELQHMLHTSINYTGPIALRYPRGTGIGIELEKEFKELPIGKGEVLIAGKDIIILAVGSMVYPALETAKLLEEHGINCTVVNARFIKPLDEALLTKLSKETNKVVTMEENVLAGGFGSAIMELFEQKGIKGLDILRFGIEDEYVPHGQIDILKDLIGLTPEKMAKKIMEHYNFTFNKLAKKVSIMFNKG